LHLPLSSPPPHPPPHRPTPFPYTTLFRSQHLQPQIALGRRHRSTSLCGNDNGRTVGAPRTSENVPHCSSCAGRRPCARCRSRRGDRKSTRLNSSHRTISYAVFCLKKKKQH